MKKAGFTLIEVVASLFILTILFGTGITFSKLSRNLYSNIVIDNYIYEIQNLLSYGKAACMEKDKEGKFNINTQTNEIKFIEAWDNIEKVIVLPKEIRIQKDLTVFITADGKIKQGNTITLIDKFGYKHEIVIRVGVDLIIVEK